MTYDHIIKAEETLEEKCFHLACGYYDTTAFLFEKAGFAAVVNCNGTFTFYTVAGEQLETVKAKPMQDGRGCYMDIFITTDGDRVIFRLPDYIWYDNYPDCDGESDRWDTKIIGTNDEIVYCLKK